jgi:predicted dehydrogenase
MLRIGCIGAGGRGRISKAVHAPDKGVQLVAACDPIQGVLDEYKKEYGPDMLVTTDYHELLDKGKLDGVFVTAPDYLHEEHAVAALERGIGVYVEKPLAITIEGCDRIIRTAKKHNAKLYIGHNMRFFPVMLKMKQIIDSGAIGQVQAIWCRHFINYGGDAYFKDWHSEQQYTTSLLLQKGAHDIDIIHWLAGSYTTRTVGMGKLSVYNRVLDRRSPDERGVAKWSKDNWPPLSQKKLSPKIDVEDHSMILMQLANGVQASYEQCHYTPDAMRNYTIIGTQGRIENIGDHSSDTMEARVCVWSRRCAHTPTGTESYAIPMLSGSHGGADPNIVNAFVEYLRTGKHHGATPADARAAVATGVLGAHSLRQGSIPMDVPPIMMEEPVLQA